MKTAKLGLAHKCGFCGESFGKSGLPFFWRVRIERHGVNFDAVGPQVMDPVELSVCDPCAMKQTEVAQRAIREKG